MIFRLSAKLDTKLDRRGQEPDHSQSVRAVFERTIDGPDGDRFPEIVAPFSAAHNLGELADTQGIGLGR
jgi:hypothetical protein